MQLKPIYLLADSQLLFYRDQGTLFIQSLLKYIDSPRPSAAYIGAANGDIPAFFDIFTGSMAQIALNRCQQISSGYTDADHQFLQQADVILLAGGDPELGWRVMQASAMGATVVERYLAGAVLMGVSAGAVHLGLCGCTENPQAQTPLFDTFQLVPLMFGAHEEKDDWKTLKHMLRHSHKGSRGIGIPSGGGLIYHPDHTLEPIRHPAFEFVAGNDGPEFTTLLHPHAYHANGGGPQKGVNPGEHS
ncbi:MAG: hypothetical protein Tsb002_28190 [Wenzhouxiangellaceae bacterium]